VLSEEALRQTLIAAGLSHQRTRSWKWSPDPDFTPKAERVLGLYRAKPDDGVVVCFDEMGPIQLIPHHGSGWAPAELLLGAASVRHAGAVDGRHDRDGYERRRSRGQTNAKTFKGPRRAPG
jgi:hypothetical protein